MLLGMGHSLELLLGSFNILGINSHSHDFFKIRRTGKEEGWLVGGWGEWEWEEERGRGRGRGRGGGGRRKSE